MLFEPCFSHLIKLRAGSSLFFTTVYTAVPVSLNQTPTDGGFQSSTFTNSAAKDNLVLQYSPTSPSLSVEVLLGSSPAGTAGSCFVIWTDSAKGDRVPDTRHSPNSKALGDGWERPGQVPPPGGVAREGPRSRGGAKAGAGSAGQKEHPPR